MTYVYFIRHAEAEGNYFRRAHGQYDSPLTALGYRQLRYLAARFDGVQLDAVYASDLKRAVETARSVAGPRGMEPVQLRSLRETAIGVWEDRPWGSLEWENREMLRRYNSDPMRWSVPGGEPASETQQRMLETVRNLARKHRGGTIAVFSHGAAIRLLLAGIRGTPSHEIRWSMRGDNTGVTLLKVDEDDIHIEYEGDNSHLPPELSGLAKQTWWKRSDGITDNPRLRPWNPVKERTLYMRLYADAWRCAHGDAPFDPQPYWQRAAARSAADPGSVVVALAGDTALGLMEMDDTGIHKNEAGHIAFYAMLPEYRERRLSPVLMGEAISRYRGKGLERLRLFAAPENEKAVGYYQHMGFTRIGETSGALGSLLIMERDIRV